LFGLPDLLTVRAANMPDVLAHHDLTRHPTFADWDLIISGRSKELIIRGGHDISPVEIEDALHSHSAVAEAAVIGVHAVLGEDIAAFVVLRPGSKVSGEQLRTWCSSMLADNKLPRHWYFVEALPRNQNEKVLKGELQFMRAVP
jgi:acyl-coenzyme A synthetase/AMP-(fatty) acid ligase